MDIIKYARIVAIIGILFSCISLILSIFAWNYFPMSIALLLAFVLGLLGLNKSKPGYLLAADIILGMNIFCLVLFIVVSLYNRLTKSQALINDYHEIQLYRNPNSISKFSYLQIPYFIYAIIFVIIIGFQIFAFILFYNMRKHLIKHPTSSAETSHHFGYFSNLPMYSQDHNEHHNSDAAFKEGNSNGTSNSEESVQPVTSGVTSGVVTVPDEIQPSYC